LAKVTLEFMAKKWSNRKKYKFFLWSVKGSGVVIDSVICPSHTVNQFVATVMKDRKLKKDEIEIVKAWN